MDSRYHQGIGSSINLRTNHFIDLCTKQWDAWKRKRYSKQILKPLKRFALPIGAISTSFLFANFAYAESFLERGNVEGGYFDKESMQNRGYKWESLTNVVNFLSKIVDWLKDFRQNAYELSIDLLSYVYEMVTNIVIHTPLFIFNNSFTSNLSYSLSKISISAVIILTMIEGIKRMLSQTNKKIKPMEFKTILKRIPIALGVTGIAPFLFEKGFSLLNQLTKSITLMGGTNLSSESLVAGMSISAADVFSLLLFDVVLIGLLIPVILQNAKRWWELFVLSSITPLAFTAWIFDDHKHFHKDWWNTIKKHATTQLVYATFIMAVGAFIAGTRFVAPEAWSLKAIILIGALFSMVNPPNIIRRYTGSGGDVEGLLQDAKRSFVKVTDTIKMKKLIDLLKLNKKK